MLCIRNEQMEALNREMRRRFVDEMVVSLRDDFPEKLEDVPDEQLRETIDGGIEAAENYGVTDANDVEGFIWYVIEFGLEFGESPETEWAAAILKRDDLTSTEKMGHIEDHYLHEVAQHE
jgi:hypothetical protein